MCQRILRCRCWARKRISTTACAEPGTGPAATNRSTPATPAVCHCCLPSTPSSTFQTACTMPHARPAVQCLPVLASHYGTSFADGGYSGRAVDFGGWSHAAGTALGTAMAIATAFPGATAAMAAAMRTGRAPKRWWWRWRRGRRLTRRTAHAIAFHSCLRPRKGRCSPISCKNPERSKMIGIGTNAPHRGPVAMEHLFAPRLQLPPPPCRRPAARHGGTARRCCVPAPPTSAMGSSSSRARTPAHGLVQPQGRLQRPGAVQR